MREKKQKNVCRIIPPYAEGTPHIRPLLSDAWKNHPSPYGGNTAKWLSDLSGKESSLRMQRVPAHAHPDGDASRIIPPHTMGTSATHSSAAGFANHSSIYGGYNGAFHQVDRLAESSLRIRRVRINVIPHIM